MGPRAAWRLESLGFRSVYVYAAGKADWSAAGLPLESERAQETLIGDVVRDVPTCGLGARVGDVVELLRESGEDVCIVTVGDGIVVGELRESDLSGDPDGRAEDVMRSGPTTFRPDRTVAEMREYMRERGLRGALVTTNDGRLIGQVRAAELEEGTAEASDERLITG